MTDLSSEYMTINSAILNILKNKDTTKGCVKRSNNINQSEDKSAGGGGNLLLIWLNEKHLAANNISEAMICGKKWDIAP